MQHSFQSLKYKKKMFSKECRHAPSVFKFLSETLFIQKVKPKIFVYKHKRQNERQICPTSEFILHLGYFFKAGGAVCLVHLGRHF
jgi:hypothetical protein